MLVQILKVDQDIYHGHSPRLLSCLIKTKLHKQLAPLPETQLQIIFSNGDVRYLMFPSRILSYSQRGISPRKCLYLKLDNKIMLKMNFLQQGFILEKGKVLSNGGFDPPTVLQCYLWPWKPTISAPPPRVWFWWCLCLGDTKTVYRMVQNKMWNCAFFGC